MRTRPERTDKRLSQHKRTVFIDVIGSLFSIDENFIFRIAYLGTESDLFFARIDAYAVGKKFIDARIGNRHRKLPVRAVAHERERISPRRQALEAPRAQQQAPVGADAPEGGFQRFAFQQYALEGQIVFEIHIDAQRSDISPIAAEKTVSTPSSYE